MKALKLMRLLKSGVHLGHQVHVWNPVNSMYLAGVINNMHIIDLEQTLFLLKRTVNFVSEVIKNNGTVLFVGTSKDIAGIVKKGAQTCHQPYIESNWVGGTLTNWNQTVKIKSENKKFDYLSGIRPFNNLPDVLFVLDVNNNQTAIKEANYLNIPVIGIIDSNSQSNGIDYPIPGNDDSIRSLYLYTYVMANTILMSINNKDK